MSAASWIAVTGAVIALGHYCRDWFLATIVGACFLFLAVFGQWESAMVTLASVLIAVIYMWVFDEFQIWYRNRNTAWRLTNRALYINSPDTAEPLVLPLTDIRSIGKLSLWSITLGLPDGQRVTLPLVPQLRETMARLAQAIEVTR